MWSKVIVSSNSIWQGKINWLCLEYLNKQTNASDNWVEKGAYQKNIHPTVSKWMLLKLEVTFTTVDWFIGDTNNRLKRLKFS